jgi:hypothetical protein
VQTAETMIILLRWGACSLLLINTCMISHIMLRFGHIITVNTAEVTKDLTPHDKLTLEHRCHDVLSTLKGGRCEMPVDTCMNKLLSFFSSPGELMQSCAVRH